MVSLLTRIREERCRNTRFRSDEISDSKHTWETLTDKAHPKLEGRSSTDA